MKNQEISRALAAIAIGGLPWACSSFGTNGSAAEADAATADGGIDDANGDSNAAPDAAIEASVSGSCGTGSFTFCDDFERSTVVDNGWARFGPYEMTIDTSTAASPSRSLRIALDLSTATGFLTRPLPSNARRMRVAFQMNLEPAMPYAQLVSLEFQDKNLIFQHAGGGGLIIVEQDFTAQPQYYKTTSIGNSGLGWARYELTIDLDGSKITVTRNGTDVGQRTLERTYADLHALRIGITYSSGPGPATVRFDDVGYELLP